MIGGLKCQLFLCKCAQFLTFPKRKTTDGYSEISAQAHQTKKTLHNVMPHCMSVVGRNEKSSTAERVNAIVSALKTDNTDTLIKRIANLHISVLNQHISKLQLFSGHLIVKICFKNMIWILFYTISMQLILRKSISITIPLFRYILHWIYDIFSQALDDVRTTQTKLRIWSVLVNRNEPPAPANQAISSWESKHEFAKMSARMTEFERKRKTNAGRER